MGLGWRLGSETERERGSAMEVVRGWRWGTPLNKRKQAEVVGDRGENTESYEKQRRTRKYRSEMECPVIII